MEAFWPVFNEMKAREKPCGRNAPRKPFEEMSDEEAETLLDNQMKMEERRQPFAGIHGKVQEDPSGQQGGPSPRQKGVPSPVGQRGQRKAATQERPPEGTDRHPSDPSNRSWLRCAAIGFVGVRQDQHRLFRSLKT